MNTWLSLVHCLPSLGITLSSKEISSEGVLKVYPSETNFLLVQFDDPKSIMSHLMSHGVVVRDRSKERGCEGCLRITVGLEEENDKLLNLLR